MEDVQRQKDTTDQLVKQLEQTLAKLDKIQDSQDDKVDFNALLEEIEAADKVMDSLDEQANDLLSKLDHILKKKKEQQQ
jgi:hypothetical protein